jgi:fructoselysine-6-P-deglycase FrlB-like protein
MKVRLGMLTPCSMTILESEYSHVYKAEEETVLKTATFVLSMMDALQFIGAKSYEMITLYASACSD